MNDGSFYTVFHQEVPSGNVRLFCRSFDDTMAARDSVAGGCFSGHRCRCADRQVLGRTQGRSTGDAGYRAVEAA